MTNVPFGPALILTIWTICLLLSCPSPASAEVQVEIARSELTSDFAFPNVPAPASNDAGADAIWSIVDGTKDSNSPDIDVLHDGRIPDSHDQPSANFFFRAGTKGGRIRVDLKKTISVQRIGTYSWHREDRAPQVYDIYGADDTTKNLRLDPPANVPPQSCGWKLIAKVDSRSKATNSFGQHAVAITDSTGALGNYRYLLFDIDVTETRDPYGNTFFSEIDIIDADGPELQFVKPATSERVIKTFQTDDARFQFAIDMTLAPDLTKWTDEKLIPTIVEWYPKIVELFPSKDFHAKRAVRFRYRDDMGEFPAWAAGNEVSLNAPWFRREKDREALGAVVHELVHVVQEYPRTNPPPKWLVEGIPDYVRWFRYEPDSRGAAITPRNLKEARYDASYRISANFLNWVSENSRDDFVSRLNAAIREGRYKEDLWKELTGKPLTELGGEWKSAQEERLKRKETRE